MRLSIAEIEKRLSELKRDLSDVEAKTKKWQRLNAQLQSLRRENERYKEHLRQKARQPKSN